MSDSEVAQTRVISVPRAPTGMIRDVITEADAEIQGNGLPDKPDDYKTRLIKYVPTEAVVLYTSLIGIPAVLEEQSPFWYWFGMGAVLVGGLAAVPLILIRGYGIEWQYKKRQIILSMVAYLLWVASIGTFQGIVPVPPPIVTVALGLFTAFVPFVDPGTKTSDGAQ